MKIQIDKIDVSKEPIREAYDQTEIDKLVNSIRLLGLLNAITVKSVAPSLQSERFEILAGNKRYYAVKKLGWKDIECVVVEPKDRYEEFLYSLHENEIRENLTWQERIMATKKEKELYESKFPEAKRGIAGAIGKKIKRNPATELNTVVKGFAESKAECENTSARKIYSDLNLVEESKKYPEILAEETKTNALTKLIELKTENKLKEAGDMSKLEVMRMRNENARLVRFTNRNHRNCIRFSQAESLEHLLKKCEVCYNLSAEEKEFLTESIFENGSRADIFVLDDGRIIEICKSEEVEDCKVKASKYPVSDIEYVKIKKE